MRMKAYYTGYTNYSVRDFTVEVEDTCSSAQLKIDLPEFKDYYKIADPEIIENINPSLIISSETEVICPPLIIEIVNSADESAIDTSIFTYDNSRSDKFRLFSTDLAMAGTYNLRLKTYYSGYTNYSTRDFQILVDFAFKSTVNQPPRFDNFDETTVTQTIIKSKDENGWEQSIIELGPISDEDDDSYSIQYDSNENYFITFNKETMTLNIAKDATFGVYEVLFQLEDDSEYQTTSEYKFIFFIIAQEEERS